MPRIRKYYNTVLFGKRPCFRWNCPLKIIKEIIITGNSRCTILDFEFRDKYQKKIIKQKNIRKRKQQKNKSIADYQKSFMKKLTAKSKCYNKKIQAIKL